MFPRKIHILYVEAHDDTRAMMEFLFEQSDFRVTTVHTAEKCLELVKHNCYDLILLEYSLAGLSGVTLCSEIRKVDGETPVVFFSSRAFPAERAAALNAGAQAYLVKPNDLFRITEEITQIISQHEQEKKARVPIFIPKRNWQTPLNFYTFSEKDFQM